MAHELALRLINDISEIARMADALREWGNSSGISASVMNEITIALDDLATNVINYAFPNGGRHEIGICVSLVDGTIRCTMTDDGVPFDPLKLESPKTDIPVGERKIGGLGIALARALVDSLNYSRSNGMNILTLRKDIHDA